MNKKALIGALAVVIAAVAVWFFVFRGHGHAAKPVEAGAGSDTKAAVAKPTGNKSPRSQGPAVPHWSLDEDREGPLRLEGQVRGPDGEGVKGATVYLGTVPGRTATTEEDGSFAFDKLIGRTYDLSAESGDLIGGPIAYKLTEKSDPVVIRLATGAAISVTVVDEKDAPIKGASVLQKSHVAVTDDKGVVTIKPVSPGWVQIAAMADGYAPAAAFATIGTGGAVVTVKITLHKGIGVSGVVLDDKGAPIAKAKVRATRESWFGGANDSDKQVVTDAKGQFQIAALPPGAHTLEAFDGDHAPAQSAPFVVSDKPITNITITMKAGAVLAGKVTSTDGKPAPYAIVRVASNANRAWEGAARQTSCDAQGEFELRGLAQKPVTVRAESDTAASKVVDVDLEKKPETKDLVLTLDVSGTISGTVVDDKGQPVAEIEVNAFPDILGGGKTENLALAGFASSTTDGAGAFTVHGLTDGQYKLWAAHSNRGFGEWGQHGVSAKTGDTGVKITMPGEGELKGKIVLDGQSTPPTPAYVAIGQQPGTPIDKDGTFDLKDVESGTFDVTFRGPQFATFIQRDVKIDPSKTTDMGTVTVFRGRKMTGKVVDGKGAPVPGAKVRVGEMLFSSENADSQFDNIGEMYGVRSAITDQDGAFSLIGISKKGSTAIAEHPDLGRSASMSIPAGTEDVPPQTIVLHGFGSIVGKVTSKGQPLGGVTVTQSLKGGAGLAFTASETAEDGSFTMSKVPEGEIVLQAMQQKMMSMKATTQNVTVIAGKQSVVTIDIPVGTIALTVNVVAKPNNQVDSAQVFLFSGTVAFKSAKEINDGFTQGGAQGMKFWLGKGMTMPEFDELVAGSFSACVIPITGSISDPKFQQRIQENIATLAVYCKTMSLQPSPNAQSMSIEVPAMNPLPGD